MSIHVKQFYSRSRYEGDLEDEQLGLQVNWRRVLSNFYVEPLSVKGVTYRSPEHAFHAAKYRYSSKPELGMIFAEGGSGHGPPGGQAGGWEAWHNLPHNWLTSTNEARVSLT